MHFVLVQLLFLVLWHSLAVAAPAPYVWWKFDEGTGSTAADSGTCGCPGTLQASPTWVAGAKGGSALQFNGSTQYVTSTASVSINPPMTVAFWVNAGSTANGTFNVGQGAVRIAAHVPFSDNILYWDSCGNASERTNTSFSSFLNVWTHVALTSNGTNNRQIYINGTSVATNVNNTTNCAAQTTLEVGRYNVSGSNSWQTGRIDEFQMWKTILTTQEIQEVMAGTGTTRWRMMWQWLQRFERTLFAGGTLPWLR